MFSKNTPNITVVSEYGLYCIFAKCNLPKCEPLSNPLIPVTPLESLANRDHPRATFVIYDKRGFFVPRKYPNR